MKDKKNKMEQIKSNTLASIKKGELLFEISGWVLILIVLKNMFQNDVLPWQWTHFIQEQSLSRFSMADLQVIQIFGYFLITCLSVIILQRVHLSLVGRHLFQNTLKALQKWLSGNLSQKIPLSPKN